MSTATATPPVIAPTWKCPEVRIGDIVHWFHGGSTGETPAAALVLGLGFAQGRTLRLRVFRPQGQMIDHDGVRHASDPDIVGNPEKTKPGTWRHIPGGAGEMLNQIVEYAALCEGMKGTIAALTQRVAALEKGK